MFNLERHTLGQDDTVIETVAPVQYMDRLRDLNYSIAYGVDMLTVDGWEPRHPITLQMKSKIIFVHRARLAFINETRALTESFKDPKFTQEWHSHTLDSVLFSIYYDDLFSNLDQLRQSSRWHADCRKNGNFDVLKLGES